MFYVNISGLVDYREKHLPTKNNNSYTRTFGINLNVFESHTINTFRFGGLKISHICEINQSQTCSTGKGKGKGKCYFCTQGCVTVFSTDLPHSKFIIQL